MTLRMSWLAPLQSAWQAREPRERRTLALGGIVIVLLLAYLGLPRLLDVFTSGAETTRPMPDMPVVQPLTATDWQAAADRHGIQALEITTQAQAVQLAGRVSDVEHLEALAHWAAQQGWWATQWSLTRRADDEMTMQITLMAELEHLEASTLAGDQP